MLIKTKMITMTLCVVGLSACSSWYQNSQIHSYPTKNRSSAIQLYPDGYDNGGAYAPDSVSTTLSKPHTASSADGYQANVNTVEPASFKMRDKSWVSSQNPQGYTIELSNGEKASDVAGTLQKAPKNERMAEVKYQRDGKQYYKCVYGSYPTYEAAQQALSTLPEDVKQGATVKTWGHIQSVSE